MTSDERREVAARLRVYSHDFDFGDSNPFWYVSKAAFGDVDAHTYHSVFARLADLIDPTCKVESVEPIRYGEFNQEVGSAFSLSCGHTVMRACTDMPPAFCDECGARVVDGGDA